MIRGGEPNGKIQLFNDPQVNSIVIPIYKNGGKRIFEFGDRLNPPHCTPKFENPHYRVKKKSCRKPYIWVSKPIRRKIQEQWKNN